MRCHNYCAMSMNHWYAKGPMNESTGTIIFAVKQMAIDTYEGKILACAHVFVTTYVYVYP